MPLIPYPNMYRHGSSYQAMFRYDTSLPSEVYSYYEGFHADNPKFLRKNVFTHLTDDFSESGGLNISGFPPHSLLWDVDYGNWYIDNGFLRCDDNIGHISFYNDYDISNRSDLSYNYLNAVVSLGGTGTVWNINDQIWISGSHLTPSPYEGFTSYTYVVKYKDRLFYSVSQYEIASSYPRVPTYYCVPINVINVSSGCPTAPISAIIVDNRNTSYHAVNEEFVGKNLSITLEQNPYQTARIDYVAYHEPTCVYANSANTYQLTIENFVDNPANGYNCSALNGTYIISKENISNFMEGSGNQIKYIYSNLGTKYIDDDNLDYLMYVYTSGSQYSFVTPAKQDIIYQYNGFLSTKYNYTHQGYRSSDGMPSGILEVDNRYYDYRYGIIDVKNPILTVIDPMYLYKDGYIKPYDPYTPSLATVWNVIKSASGFNESFNLYAFNPSEYTNGLVHLQNYSYNPISGIITFGRFDYIWDGELYSIPSGRTVEVASTNDIEPLPSAYISYSHALDDFDFDLNLEERVFLAYFDYRPVIYTQNVTARQLKFPSRTLYPNISSYIDLDQFTYEFIDYEYGKGVNLVKISPTGENFEFYCRRYYSNGERYYKLDRAKNKNAYILAFNYNNVLTQTSGHNVNNLPLLYVSYSGDPPQYTIADYRPQPSGNTWTGFDNVYPLPSVSTYWQDDGVVVSHDINKNVLTINVDPAGNREDFSYYYEDIVYTKTHDSIDIENPLGKRLFIVYKNDELVAYSGTKSSLNASYTNKEISDITGTGLLLYSLYCNKYTPSHHMNTTYFSKGKALDVFSPTVKHIFYPQSIVYSDTYHQCNTFMTRITATPLQ